ncbi:MAG: TerB family tellurite resistance protein, partial [Candidatus Thermoplasmatota archaeon]|nr:TerB family tellurite resistance protein [Candidatus Thermoplasmatota archaeon]
RGMLPDTLHTLPQNERFAYAKLLAFIAKIDNDVTVDEMAMFEQRMGTALLSPNQRAAIRDYLQNPPTLSECLEDLKISSDGKAGKLALRDAIMMSAADGTVDEDEFDVLLKIATGLGMEESVVDDLLDWVMDGYDWMDRGIKILDAS